jgi:RNA polymerase sigma factor (TIGR02999 family)
MTDVSRILHSAEQGDPHAVAQLLPLVYNELRRMAEQQLAGERAGQTLQATALVHEAYLRLIGDKGAGNDAARWQNRRHFFGAAAEAMRRILIDAARRRQSQKRGGGAARRDVEPDEIAAPERSDELLTLDEALERLAAEDAPAADLVKLRYFAGLSLPDAAKVLEISPRSADRLWAYARAWLHRQITQES